MSMVPLNLQGELSSVAFGLPRATLHHQTGYNLLRAKRCQANSIKINYTGSPTAIKRFASRSPDGRPSKMACHRRVQKYIMLHNHLLLWFLCIFQVFIDFSGQCHPSHRLPAHGPLLYLLSLHQHHQTCTRMLSTQMQDGLSKNLVGLVLGSLQQKSQRTLFCKFPNEECYKSSSLHLL